MERGPDIQRDHGRGHHPQGAQVRGPSSLLPGRTAPPWGQLFGTFLDWLIHLPLSPSQMLKNHQWLPSPLGAGHPVSLPLRYPLLLLQQRAALFPLVGFITPEHCLLCHFWPPLSAGLNPSHPLRLCLLLQSFPGLETLSRAPDLSHTSAAEVCPSCCFCPPNMAKE